jgi:hypothetical protein
VQNERRQGILPYQVEVSDKLGHTTARGGLPLVVETMRALGLESAIEKHLRLRQRESGYTDVEKIEALVLLLAAGGDCLDDMRTLQADEGLERLLGRELPSPDTLRHFLYAFHDQALIDEALKRRAPGVVAFIPEESGALVALGRVNTALVHAVAANGKSKRATLDHDATIQESRKREALCHYKGGRGYQPACVYWAEEDLVVTDEYRDGNVPAGMENLPLIKKGFVSLPSTVSERFFRADSACYESAVLKWLADEERPDGPKGPIGFSISADMTPELSAVCRAVPEADWQLVEERSDATVSAADVEFTPGNWNRRAEPLRYVAVRIKKRQGLLFASGYDSLHLAVVTNRRDLSEKDLLEWHWQKAGTIEQVHDVTKNELGAGTPPCGRFGANAAWYRLALLTYNVLSAMKSLALPPKYGSAKPKKLRFALFQLAGRITEHAGRLVLTLSRAAEQLVELIRARRRLAELLPAPS